MYFARVRLLLNRVKLFYARGGGFAAAPSARCCASMLFCCAEQFIPIQFFLVFLLCGAAVILSSCWRFVRCLLLYSPFVAARTKHACMPVRAAQSTSLFACTMVSGSEQSSLHSVIWMNRWWSGGFTFMSSTGTCMSFLLTLHACNAAMPLHPFTVQFLLFAAYLVGG